MTGACPETSTVGTVGVQAWGKPGPRGRAAAGTVIRDLLLVCKCFLWACWQPALGGGSRAATAAVQREAVEGLALCSPHHKALPARAPWFGVVGR